MDVYKAAISRRSIRRFKDTPVPYDALEKCVNAARLAPSGVNRQPCEYMIIDDEQLLPKVFDSITRWAGQPKPKGTLLEHTPKAYILILKTAPWRVNFLATRGLPFTMLAWRRRI